MHLTWQNGTIITIQKEPWLRQPCPKSFCIFLPRVLKPDCSPMLATLKDLAVIAEATSPLLDILQLKL